MEAFVSIRVKAEEIWPIELYLKEEVEVSYLKGTARDESTGLQCSGIILDEIEYNIEEL